MTPIVAVSDRPIRELVGERLLAAGCERVLPVADAAGLREALQAAGRGLVVAGGAWTAARPFASIAIETGAMAIVLLGSVGPAAGREALAMGVRAILRLEAPSGQLAAALAAVRTGLLVLDGSAAAAQPAAARLTAAQNQHTRREWTTAASLASARPQASLASARLQARLASAHRQLTAREREILTLVASGTSNKGIARALGVSANTVKFHLAAAFDKLSAATRAEAVAEAIRRGDLSV